MVGRNPVNRNASMGAENAEIHQIKHFQAAFCDCAYLIGLLSFLPLLHFLLHLLLHLLLLLVVVVVILLVSCSCGR